MDLDLEFSAQSYSKMVMHGIKYPHATCSGLLLSPKVQDDDNVMRIIEAIPVSHASQGVTPNIEIAYNSVSMYCHEQELVISGYYQTERYGDGDLCAEAFSKKVTEKISENYKNAVLCGVGTEGTLEPHQLIDKIWIQKTNFRIEADPEIIADNVLYSKEKLYSQIVDFDDHFNNIALDWTNAKITQRIDHLVANVC